MNQETNRPITVEDLLRLKRAERPPAEFWDQFDRELRAKQLAALVEKTPWWRSLPRAFAGFSRYSLPVGATAVLALTFLATRDYDRGSAPNATTAGAAVAVVTQPNLSEVLSDAVDSPEALTTIALATESLAPRVTQPTPDQVLASARHVNIFSTIESADASADREFVSARSDDADASPSARHIAANLAAAQAAAPALTRGLLGATRGFEDRALPARATMEPLTQVSTPAERSRARFATAMVTSFSGDTRGRATSANVARRISDERVYDDDAIRRVGATGNSVAWKF